MSLMDKLKKTAGALIGDDMLALRGDRERSYAGKADIQDAWASSMRPATRSLQDNAALNKWQERLEDARRAYAPELEAMSRREDLYAGSRRVAPGANAKKAVAKDASNIRNITFELIESQVDCTLRNPKVTPLHSRNEANARAVENVLRADLDRLPFEFMNDEQERTCPIQGGSVWLVEWDNTLRTHTSVGDVTVQLLHPRQVIPQPGVTSLQRSDYVFVQLSQTKEFIRRRYGVDVDGEEESNPEAGRVLSDTQRTRVDTKVTQNIVYFRNDSGSIGKFSWVNDVILEHMQDYQARHLEACAKCGAPRIPGQDLCACGSKRWRNNKQEYETLEADIPLPDGGMIPAMSQATRDGLPVTDALGQPQLMPTRLPWYTPNRFPLVVRRNVSVFGKFLGDSDVDKIADQQEFVKKLGTKIEEKLLMGGSAITLPRGASFSKNDKEFKVIEVKSPSDTAAIQAITLQPNVSYDSAEKERAYYEAKSTLGITDAYQGKPDVTATSGVAKRVSVSQAAGRLESKRRMKDAAYAELFQLIFQFRLAYCDEPRPYRARNAQGKPEYGAFNRYAFLEQDAAGEWYYNDQYLFSVDTAGSLANNREAMWQEARMNLQTGAFGQPGDPKALLLFWQIMESLHYPKAGDIKAQLEEQATQQEAMMQQQQMMMQNGGQTPGMLGEAGGAAPDQANGAPAAQAAMSRDAGGVAGAAG